MMRGMNMKNMMNQVKKMQKQMKADQKSINEKQFIGQAPDKMVKVVFTGDRKMKDIKIKKEAIDPDDPDMLSDLVLSAVNDALSQIEKATNDSMGKYTKNIPGM